MDREKAEKAWQEYLMNFFQGSAAFLMVDEESGLPYLFSNAYCATCNYWHPIHRDGLNQLTDPHELNHVVAGLQGNILKAVSLGDEHIDAYKDHEFYGWCKRYPPTYRDSYSIIRLRTIFSLISKKVPKKISDYQFPLMSHMNNCGEWKKGTWVEAFINANKKK